MSNNEHILISLVSRHAKNIFDGNKRVEFRRRTMHITPGTTAWIYVKLPIGAITGRVKVTAIHTSSPTALWQRFSAVSGLSKNEFFDYFSGVAVGVALELGDTRELRQSISLLSLREISTSFQPPQFFSRLTVSNPIFKIVMTKSIRTKPKQH